MADQDPPKPDKSVPRVALGVAAHPDDLDFGMGGTAAHWAAQGTEVYYLILTNGNKGSADKKMLPADLTEIRRDEQRQAAAILGVKDVFFCNYDDGLLEVCQEVKRDIVRVIRRLKPDVVVTIDPNLVYDARRGFINHSDHRAAGQATLDAVYPLARDHLSFPELAAEGLAPHKVETLLLVGFENLTFHVDISDCMDKKVAALAAHASQTPGLSAIDTMMREMAAEQGKIIGVANAESYIRIDVQD